MKLLLVSIRPSPVKSRSGEGLNRPSSFSMTEMGTHELIMLGLATLISVGGFIGTIFVGILAFFIRRLIGSVDTLGLKMESLELALKDRPQHAWVESEAVKIADARVIKHESEKH